MFDAEEMHTEGFDLEMLAHIIEIAMHSLRGKKSKEARWLEAHLESIRDECEGYEAG